MAVRRSRRLMRTAGIVAMALIAGVAARREYQGRVPNGDRVRGGAALGHVNVSGGGALNDFGRDFAANDHRWTKALCKTDSDGDGRSNGQELGDPCCVWRGPPDQPTFSSGVTHPGDSNDTVSESFLLQWVCGYETASNTSSSDAEDGANPSIARDASIEDMTPTRGPDSPATLPSSAAPQSSGSPWRSPLVPASLLSAGVLSLAS